MTFKCLYCRFLCSKKTDLFEHFSLEHCELIFALKHLDKKETKKCFLCYFQFKTYRDFETHLKSHKLDIKIYKKIFSLKKSFKVFIEKELKQK